MVTAKYCRGLLTGVALAASFAVPAAAREAIATAEDGFVALIEISSGSAVKYELDEASGRMIVDRFLSMPVAYPANYGFIRDTLAGDGDPLDVLVLTRFPVMPGSLIRVRPLGVLRMTDGGAGDDKIIAVPVSAVDPTYDGIEDVADLPAMELQRLEAFFRTYKQLPGGNDSIWLGGFASGAAAKAELEAARRNASQP